MVRRKIKGWVSPVKWKHNLSVLIFSLFLSGVLFFLASEGVAYLIFRDKIKDYTTDVLVRAESLLIQLESVRVAAKTGPETGGWPCSYENLRHLRVVIWPYPLIKDAGYTTRNGLICSALWGNLHTPLSLERLDKKWSSRGRMWLFGVKLQDDISADVYLAEDVMVIVSPFVFRRFETDTHTANFSAVVGNRKHDRHYFKIGPDAAFLDRHDGVPLKFRVFRACSLQYDLCVAGGGYVTGVLSEHWSILMLMAAASVISGLMIYIIIMNRTELNSPPFLKIRKSIKK